MLKNNIYNIEREFDYPAIKDIVMDSLEKIAKEALKKRPNAPDHVISNCVCSGDVKNIGMFATTASIMTALYAIPFLSRGCTRAIPAISSNEL